MKPRAGKRGSSDSQQRRPKPTQRTHCQYWGSRVGKRGPATAGVVSKSGGTATRCARHAGEGCQRRTTSGGGSYPCDVTGVRRYKAATAVERKKYSVKATSQARQVTLRRHELRWHRARRAKDSTTNKGSTYTRHRRWDAQSDGTCPGGRIHDRADGQYASQGQQDARATVGRRGGDR